MNKDVAHWQQIALYLAALSILPTGVTFFLTVTSENHSTSATAFYTSASTLAIIATLTAFTTMTLSILKNNATPESAFKHARTTGAAFGVSAFAMSAAGFHAIVSASSLF